MPKGFGRTKKYYNNQRRDLRKHKRLDLKQDLDNLLTGKSKCIKTQYSDTIFGCGAGGLSWGIPLRHIER